MTAYHDEEWGVPVHDDRALFEFLVLEGAQAGLSWSTILNKRANYRKAFDRFDPRKVARYGEGKVAVLLGGRSVIRSSSKPKRFSATCSKTVSRCSKRHRSGFKRRWPRRGLDNTSQCNQTHTLRSSKANSTNKNRKSGLRVEVRIRAWFICR